MIHPTISFDAERLLFLALSFFAILAAFSGGPCGAVAQSSSNNNGTTIPVDVGVVLDLETWVGLMGLSCINMSLSDFYSSNPSYKTRLVLNVRDSKQDEVAAAAAGSKINIESALEIQLDRFDTGIEDVSKSEIYRYIAQVLRSYETDNLALKLESREDSWDLVNPRKAVLLNKADLRA